MEEKVHFGEWVKIPILPIRKRKKKVNILDLSRVEHQHEALFREFIKTRNVWRELVSNMLGVFMSPRIHMKYTRRGCYLLGAHPCFTSGEGK